MLASKTTTSFNSNAPSTVGTAEVSSTSEVVSETVETNESRIFLKNWKTEREISYGLGEKENQFKQS